MSLVDAIILLLWFAITVYAVLAGADFGGGVLDLFAGGKRSGRRRSAITLIMGPVWEANHVWLILFIVGLFVVFPVAFEVLSTALFMPLVLALAGIVLRGASFAFRSQLQGAGLAQAWWGRVFGMASVVTPFLFGAVAGALAVETIRFKDGVVETSGALAIWTGPFQLVCGALALAICAYLAATFLTVEMDRLGEAELTEDFRVRALWASAIAGALSIGALLIAFAEADRLHEGLTGKALPLVVLGIAAGSASLAAMWLRRYIVARAAVVVAVAAVIWGWGVAQHPLLVGQDVTVAGSHASEPMMIAFIVAVGSGILLLLPMWWILYAWFRRDRQGVPD